MVTSKTVQVTSLIVEGEESVGCHVLWYRFTNILEKTAACIFCSEIADSWFPHNAFQSLVDDTMSCSKMVILAATNV